MTDMPKRLRQWSDLLIRAGSVNVLMGCHGRGSPEQCEQGRRGGAVPLTPGASSTMQNIRPPELFTHTRQRHTTLCTAGAVQQCCSIRRAAEDPDLPPNLCCPRLSGPGWSLICPCIPRLPTFQHRLLSIHGCKQLSWSYPCNMRQCCPRPLLDVQHRLPSAPAPPRQHLPRWFLLPSFLLPALPDPWNCIQHQTSSNRGIRFLPWSVSINHHHW